MKEPCLIGMGRSIKAFKKWAKPELKCLLGGVKPIENYKEIPIIINNFNRLEMLKRLVNSLTGRGYNNIYIIDNASTYEPLLEWYRTCPYPVYMLNRNVGHIALWKTDIYKQFYDSYYAYTDPDVEIHPDCPDDFMERFVNLLKRHPKVLKAGFSLCIDDLPDCFKNKEKVQEWESQFWRRKVEPNVYDALIDTTFAVYKPYFRSGLVEASDNCLRVGFPYSLRHLPWYMDSGRMSEEEKYYLEHIRTSTHWSVQNK